jgi:hypothetical protein
MAVAISGTTGITNVDGSAAAPANKGSTSSTAGVFFPAANTVAISTNSTEALRVDASQNVGIGTSSPAAKLEVSGAVTRLTSTNPNLQINSTASPGYKSNINFLQSGSAKYEIGVDIANNGNNNLFFYDNVVSSERARIDSNGNLLVGRTSLVTPSGLSTVNVQSSSGFSAYNGVNAAQYAIDRIGFNSSNFYVLNASSVGVVLVNGNTSWSAQSDERLKDIIEPIANAVDKVATLRAVIGRYKTDNDSKQRAFLMAQDVQAVLPEAVSEDADGHLLLGYSETIPLLVAAIQELKAQNDELKARLEALEAK